MLFQRTAICANLHLFNCIFVIIIESQDFLFLFCNYSKNYIFLFPETGPKDSCILSVLKVSECVWVWVWVCVCACLCVGVFSLDQMFHVH